VRVGDISGKNIKKVYNNAKLPHTYVTCAAQRMRGSVECREGAARKSLEIYLVQRRAYIYVYNIYIQYMYIYIYIYVCIFEAKTMMKFDQILALRRAAVLCGAIV